MTTVSIYTKTRAELINLTAALITASYTDFSVRTLRYCDHEFAVDVDTEYPDAAEEIADEQGLVSVVEQD